MFNPFPFKPMKRIVEVFTAGCPLCSPVVDLVKSVACGNCDVLTHNLTETEAGNPALRRARILGVQMLPAVAVNGKLLDCCRGEGITREALEQAGIGQTA
jgi:hypothetical protein